jgi:hypothetical protein
MFHIVQIILRPWRFILAYIYNPLENRGGSNMRDAIERTNPEWYVNNNAYFLLFLHQTAPNHKNKAIMTKLYHQNAIIYLPKIQSRGCQSPFYWVNILRNNLDPSRLSQCIPIEKKQMKKLTYNSFANRIATPSFISLPWNADFESDKVNAKKG